MSSDFRNLEDTLPLELSFLAKLTKLSDKNNLIIRPIPNSFANLFNLMELNLNTNTMPGTIPIGIGRMVSLGGCSMKGEGGRGQTGGESINMLSEKELG